ncbi:aminoacyl--tRNA ligase-related protein [Peptoniphilus genitalis]
MKILLKNDFKIRKKFIIVYLIFIAMIFVIKSLGLYTKELSFFGEKPFALLFLVAILLHYILYVISSEGMIIDKSKPYILTLGASRADIINVKFLKVLSYHIPPFMIRSDVVTGVMSFAEMENMMYKIEGEDLYLIGTSEHSMIGKYINTITPEEDMPLALTSYSPCFRKEVGAHGIEERGVYRIHQFEKQEMVVICKPEESKDWYVKLWQNTVDFFRSLDIPVRTLECCSGDLADLKVKSLDVEAFSPRQNKYFEVGSCSNLGDAQARRLNIKLRGKDGTYFAHTLNNTVVAPPRMLIAFLENLLQEDGSVRIPEPLQMYMGGMTKLTPKK